MDNTATAFHEGERRAQALAGVAAPSSTFIRSFMTEQHRTFFASLPYVVLGALSPDGWPVATLATGVPGFLSSPDEITLHLAWHPLSGDPVAEALAPERPIAILGIEFATRRRNRANGTVLANDADGIRMRVLQSFETVQNISAHVSHDRCFDYPVPWRDIRHQTLRRATSS